MTYPFIVFLHAMYLLGWTFVFHQLVFKKFTFRNYIPFSIILGVVAGIISDVFGVVMFKLWEYPISASAEYFLFILIFAYAVSVPLVLETTLWVEKKLQSVQFASIKVPAFVYWVVLAASTALTGVIAIYQLQRGGVVDPWFVPALVVLAALFTGALLTLVGVEDNFLRKALVGRFLSILTPFASGLITGLIWEFLNSRVILYSITNVPPGEFIGISIYPLIGWGVLNVGFYGTAKFITQSRFMKGNMGRWFVGS